MFRRTLLRTFVSTLLLSILIPAVTFAAVHVNGYYRKDGTYVSPHFRSNPDGNPTNNWSYPGNTNPYTGETATGDPATYLDNYYNRSGGTGSGSLPGVSPYVLPATPTSIDEPGGSRTYGMLFCNAGYYKKNDACIQLPANAHAYGSSLYCDTSYYLTTDNTCVALPSNAIASYSSGYSCRSGYILQGSSCITADDWCRVTADASFDTKASTCVCPTGQLFGADKKCGTPKQLCQRQYGGYAEATDNAQCACIDGTHWNATQTMCIGSPNVAAASQSITSTDTDRVVRDLQAQVTALLAQIQLLQRTRK